MEDEALRIAASELAQLVQGRLNAWPPRETIELSREEALRIATFVEEVRGLLGRN